jgi:hypothetical protein
LASTNLLGVRINFFEKTLQTQLEKQKKPEPPIVFSGSTEAENMDKNAFLGSS